MAALLAVLLIGEEDIGERVLAVVAVGLRLASLRRSSAAVVHEVAGLEVVVGLTALMGRALRRRRRARPFNSSTKQQNLYNKGGGRGAS